MTYDDPAAREAAISDDIVHSALNAFAESEGDDQWYHGLSGGLYTEYLEGMRRALSVARDVAEKRAEEMAARVKELEQIVIDGLGAVSAAFMQSDAEWREHDKTAARHDAVVRAWRERVNAVKSSCTALAQETPHE